MRRLALFALFALAAPLLLASPLRAQEPAAASPAPMAGHAHAMGPAMGAGESCGMEDCECKAMMAKMDSAAARLAALTETMNKASGNKKVEAMAAVVNALVQDRAAMQQMMQKMHMHMMHMMMGGKGEMGGMGGMGGMGAMGGMHGKADCPAGQTCPAAAAPAQQE